MSRMHIGEGKCQPIAPAIRAAGATFVAYCSSHAWLKGARACTALELLEEEDIVVNVKTSMFKLLFPEVLFF